eukprot:scaffold6886_cov164-Amphora_coffeaeformis.AAC.13
MFVSKAIAVLATVITLLFCVVPPCFAVDSRSVKNSTNGPPPLADDHEESPSAFVKDSVLQLLANHGTCDVVILLRTPDLPTHDIGENEDKQVEYIHAHMQLVKTEQARVIKELGLAIFAPRTSWIANSIFVDGFDADMLLKIKQSKDVEQVVTNDGTPRNRRLLEDSNHYEQYSDFYFVNETSKSGHEREHGDGIRKLELQMSGIGKSKRSSIFSMSGKGKSKGNSIKGQNEDLSAHLLSVGGKSFWKEGIFGQNIVVGVSSTGFNLEHEAITQNYRGTRKNGMSFDHNYNWLEPFPQGSKAPRDLFNIGTHITGTIVGQTRNIGIAPEASFISCKSIDDQRRDTPESIIKCLEFFAAPTNLNGTHPMPHLRPHIIITPTCESCLDNSNALERSIQTLHSFGVMVVVSSGGSTPGTSQCSKISRPPAIYQDVLTVGAMAANGVDILETSAAGPAVFNGTVSDILKPDVTALGADIISSVYLDGESLYFPASGSVVAAAVTTGAIALLWSANPYLTRNVMDTLELLQETASPVRLQGRECGSIEESPNNVFGYGEINIKKALKKLPKKSKMPGFKSDD